ncbi:putative reverse transcriptase, RNA-dependent DNA polymerase, partial [Tanacetum coccineum]
IKSYEDLFPTTSNLTTSYQVPTTLNTRIHKDHSLDHVIGDIPSGVQARGMTKNTNEHGFISAVYEGKTHEDLHTFLNKKDERGIVTRNKARLVAQGYTQEGIDYDEVFALVARIKAIRLFLAYASFMGFMVYQMDVKSSFHYGTIEEEVYVCQPLGFEDPDYPDKVYKVVKALYGLHQALRACQDKYVDEILRKFGFTDVRIASTLMDTEKPLLKDSDGDDVDIHLYRSMIGSLMYLTSCRPDIMFAVCVCARFQVTPKVSHLHVVKRIFRYLKGQPKLGLWYPRNSPFDLVAYSDSDYAGASLDRKSTTGGCQFLGCRLISWQCKKQTVVATSSTEAEYVAAASCCGQVLWIQNQMLDYGYNFMHTMINIDNNSTICIVKNPVSHTKTKHIEIRYHFIRDCYDKKLIQVVKIHTDHNFADLLTKALDVGRISIARHIEYLNGDIEITATIDGKVKVVSEASIRRHLKLEDSDGISTLPTTEFFEQHALMGNMERDSKGYTGVDIPLFQTMLVQGQILQGEGSTIPAEQETEVPQPNFPTQTHVADEATSTGVDDRHGGAATTVFGLEAR